MRARITANRKRCTRPVVSLVYTFVADYGSPVCVAVDACSQQRFCGGTPTLT